MLLSGERIDQLYADDIQIIQSKEVFSFSIDAVLLANFPQLPKKARLSICVLEMARSASSLVGKQLQRLTKSNYNLVWQIWVNEVFY